MIKLNYFNADYYTCPHCDNNSDYITDAATGIVTCTYCNSVMTAVHSTIVFSDSRGIYIPNNFYTMIDFSLWGLDRNNFTDLSDPENEYYWESWEQLLNKAKCNYDGLEWHLEHDGGLYARSYVKYPEK